MTKAIEANKVYCCPLCQDETLEKQSRDELESDRSLLRGSGLSNVYVCSECAAILIDLTDTEYVQSLQKIEQIQQSEHRVVQPLTGEKMYYLEVNNGTNYDSGLSDGRKGITHAWLSESGKAILFEGYQNHDFAAVMEELKRK